MTDKANGSTFARLANKPLMPLVATAGRAAASYAGKKAPKLLDEKVMPKLRDAASGSEDLAGSLAGRAKAVVGGSDDGPAQTSRGGLSDREREEKRRARAEQRQARRS